MTRPAIVVDEYRLYRAFDAAGALLYVGQTGRIGLARWFEHMRDQPWAHEVARWELDPRVWSTLDGVLEAEQHAIRTEFPRYNFVHNLANPHRVPVHRERSRRVPMSRSSRQPRRRWSRRTRRFVWWSAMWLVLAVAGAVWCVIVAHVGVRESTLAGAAGSSVLFVGVRSKLRPRRRRRRR